MRTLALVIAGIVCVHSTAVSDAEEVSSGTPQILMMPRYMPAAQWIVGLDGYCPVSLTQKRQWVRGSTIWGVIYLGRTYMFAGQEELVEFWKQPDKYAPVFLGNDLVSWSDQETRQAGRREHGVFYEGRVYLFANEANLATFAANPSRYVDAALISL